MTTFAFSFKVWRSFLLKNCNTNCTKPKIYVRCFVKSRSWLKPTTATDLSLASLCVLKYCHYQCHCCCFSSLTLTYTTFDFKFSSFLSLQELFFNLCAKHKINYDLSLKFISFCCWKKLKIIIFFSWNLKSFVCINQISA